MIQEDKSFRKMIFRHNIAPNISDLEEQTNKDLKKMNFKDIYLRK